jgi:hypothetical protein
MICIYKYHIYIILKNNYIEHFRYKYCLIFPALIVKKILKIYGYRLVRIDIDKFINILFKHLNYFI